MRGELPTTSSPLPPFSDNQVFVGTVTTSAADVPQAGAGTSVEFVPLRVVGEGGMGIVYRALQQYPQRVVALKILKGSLASSRPGRRFEREIAILARLHHRGIAQLFCVGRIDQGLAGHAPFMALEFIDGEHITHYADRHRLQPRSRIELLLHVCDAISYAHAQGVIHRDLKPANILVDEAGFPKVLDFGLASIRDASCHQGHLTDDGEGMGTIDYASPEQAKGNYSVVDERSDIYSLGVILFELLTGSRPYALEGYSWSDAARRVLESSPAEISKHDRAYRGDLETIVLKAMASEQVRRYVSVAAFANDLRRFLADEPIRAKPPTHLYVAKKFIQRHRFLVTAVSLIFLALAAGLVGTTNEAHTARLAAARADRETLYAQEELTKSELAQGDALFGLGRLEDARALYDQSWDLSEKLGLSTLPAEAAEWELNTKSAVPLEVLCASPFGVQNAVYSSAQHKIALGFIAGRLEIRDLATGKTEVAAEMGKPINQIRLSPNGHYLLVVLADSFEIWDLSSEKRVQHCKVAGSWNMRISISNTMIAAETNNGLQLCMIDPSRTTPVLHLPSDVQAFQLLDDSLLAVHRSGLLTHETDGTIQTIAQIPLGRQIIFASDGAFCGVQNVNVCTIWKCTSGEKVAEITVPDGTTFSGFSGNGSVVLLGNAIETALVMDFSGQVRATFPAHRAFCVQASPDWCLSNDQTGRFIFWRFAVRSSVRPLVAPEQNPGAQTISADGEVAAIATGNGRVLLVDCPSGLRLDELHFAGIPTSLRFIDHTQKLVVALPENHVDIWDVISQRMVETIGIDQVKSIASDGVSSTFFVRTGVGRVIKISCEGSRWRQENIPSELTATSTDTCTNSPLLCIGAQQGGEIWDVSGTPRRTAILKSPAPFNVNFSFALGGTRIGAIDVAGSLRSWDLNGVQQPCLPLGLGQSSRIAGSDQSAIIAGDAHTLQLRDISTGKIIRQLSAQGHDVACSRNGEYVLAHNRRDGTVIFDLASPRRLREARHILDAASTDTDPALRFHAYAIGLPEGLDSAYRPSAADLARGYAIEHMLPFRGEGNVADAARFVDEDPELSIGSKRLLQQFVHSASK